MRRLPTLCVAAALSILLPLALQGCASDAPTTGVPDSGNTIVPDPTAPAPGSCDPLDQQIPPPSIVINGKSTDATFGIGAYQCGTITGNGYIINNFNPVLLDATTSVKVKINSDATAKLVWGLGGELTQTGDREWASAELATGCDRLTITLKSPSGNSRATYGADIRVGGENVPCPQRDVDPTDVGAIDTTPLDSVPDVPVESVVVTEPGNTLDSDTLDSDTTNSDTAGSSAATATS